jgi:hypothetical protein
MASDKSEVGNKCVQVRSNMKRMSNCAWNKVQAEKRIEPLRNIEKAENTDNSMCEKINSSREAVMTFSTLTLQTRKRLYFGIGPSTCGLATSAMLLFEVP